MKQEPARLYSQEDKNYLGFLQQRLEKSRMQKQQQWPELNQRTLTEYYEENEKLANTFLEPKKEKDDVIISAGTLESKLDVLLANVNNLDLSPEVLAYDKDENLQSEIAAAIQEIMEVTGEMDGADHAGDEEKKMIRQRELLKQGTVFVQEEWVRKFELKGKKDKNYSGQFKDYDKEKLKKNLELVFDGPSRSTLRNENVYLGDIRQFFMDNQPYVFLAYYEDYNVAKTRFGKFENFQYVKPGNITSTLKNEQKSIYDNKWTLNELQGDQVEIILYQDQPNDEFQIIINGVLLLPIGFSLCNVAPGGKYNITKQVLKPINKDFAYGKSFVSFGSVKELSTLLS